MNNNLTKWIFWEIFSNKFGNFLSPFIFLSFGQQLLYLGLSVRNSVCNKQLRMQTNANRKAKILRKIILAAAFNFFSWFRRMINLFSHVEVVNHVVKGREYQGLIQSLSFHGLARQFWSNQSIVLFSSNRSNA